MRRLHLFEIHEQSWCPSVIKDAVRDGLFTAWKILFWRNALPHVNDLLSKSEHPRLIDLCSGSGGPIPLFTDILLEQHPDIQIALTDYYPCRNWKNPMGESKVISYVADSIDATNVPDTLKGCRTLFEAFHHFKPEDAVTILSDAVSSKQPIAIFEFQRARLLDIFCLPLLAVVPVASFLQFFHTRFSWSKLIFTIIPIVPFILAFDGLISVLRTYSTPELKELAHKAGSEGYRWEVRQSLDKSWGLMTCLIGWPSEDDGVHFVEYESVLEKRSCSNNNLDASNPILAR